jgi:anti-sigma B factor antagonist
MMLTITHTEKDGRAIFGIDGRVDTDSAKQMEVELGKAVGDGNYQIVLDLSQTHYLNSEGLRILADILTQCRAKDGDVKIAAPNLKVLRVFQIIGFDRFFKIFDSVEAALGNE